MTAFVAANPPSAVKRAALPLASADISALALAGLSKRVALPLASTAVDAFSPVARKAAALPLAGVDLAGFGFPGEGLPSASCEVGALPIMARKVAALPLATATAAGLVPSSAKHAAAPLATVTITPLGPDAAKRAGLDFASIVVNPLPLAEEPASSQSSSSSWASSWSSWSSRSSWSSSFIASSSMSGSGSMTCLAYPTREDLEDVFGRSNVIKWADLDNEGDEEHIATRIEWALCAATEWLNNKLRYGPYIIPFESPYPIEVVHVTSRVAGIALYESRGVTDTTEDGTPVDALQVHREAADKFVEEILSGRKRLDLEGRKNVPGVATDL